MRNKKVKGFTLIELIVVIAIIAVLAAILIPNLMGWVGKSSLRTANANAKAVATNSATILSDLEAEGIYLKITTLDSGETTTATAAAGLEFDGKRKVGDTEEQYTYELFKKELKESAGLKKGSRWQVEFDKKGNVIAAAYAKDAGNSYIGTYPIEATEKNQYKGGFSDAMKEAKEKEEKTPAGGGDNSGGGDNN